MGDFPKSDHIYGQTWQAAGARNHKEPVVSQRCCYSCDQIGHFVRDCPGINTIGDNSTGGRMDGIKEPHSKSKGSAVDSNFKRKSTELNHVKCYICGEKGHIGPAMCGL